MPDAYVIRSWTPQWKVVYDFLKNDSTKDDKAYIFNFNAPYDWGGHAFPVANIYYNDAQSRESARFHDIWELKTTELSLAVLSDLVKQIEPDNIYFFIGAYHNRNSFPPMSTDNLKELNRRLKSRLSATFYEFDNVSIFPVTEISTILGDSTRYIFIFKNEHGLHASLSTFFRPSKDCAEMKYVTTRYLKSSLPSPFTKAIIRKR